MSTNSKMHYVTSSSAATVKMTGAVPFVAGNLSDSDSSEEADEEDEDVIHQDDKDNIEINSHQNRMVPCSNSDTNVNVDTYADNTDSYTGHQSDVVKSSGPAYDRIHPRMVSIL